MSFPSFPAWSDLFSSVLRRFYWFLLDVRFEAHGQHSYDVGLWDRADPSFASRRPVFPTPTKVYASGQLKVMYENAFGITDPPI